jgi:DNA-binding beta-propeller fold protein YncE
MIFDRNGNFIGNWGDGFFARPHGICIGADRAVYCTDDGNHTVSKFTLQGELIRTWGEKAKPSDTGYVNLPEFYASLATIKYGGPPFNRPTAVAFSSSRDMYITDGYGNARVHKFSPEGDLLFSWGEPGSGTGQFRLPHNICVDIQDRVWVVDRENSRIQIFNTNGKFLTQWTDVVRPNDIFIDNDHVVYIAELGHVDRVGPRVSLFTIDGSLLARWGNEDKHSETDLFLAPHAIAVDSFGDIYVGEVAMTHAQLDRGSRVVQKFIRKRRCPGRRLT